MSQQYDFVAIGDLVVDAFIELDKDHADVSTDMDTGRQTLLMPFGQKLPYEEVVVVNAVGNSPNAAVDRHPVEELAEGIRDRSELFLRDRSGPVSAASEVDSGTRVVVVFQGVLDRPTMPAMISSSLTRNTLIFPDVVEVTGISIFMASTNAISSPSSTLAPGSAASAQTRPATSVTILISGMPPSGTV